MNFCMVKGKLLLAVFCFWCYSMGFANDEKLDEAQTIWDNSEKLLNNSSYAYSPSDKTNYFKRVSSDGTSDWRFVASKEKREYVESTFEYLHTGGKTYRILHDCIIEIAYQQSRSSVIDAQRKAQYKRLADQEVDGIKCYVIERKFLQNEDDYALYVASLPEDHRPNAAASYKKAVMYSIRYIRFDNNFVYQERDYAKDGKIVSSIKYKNLVLNPTFADDSFILPNLPIKIMKTVEEENKFLTEREGQRQNAYQPLFSNKRPARKNLTKWFNYSNGLYLITFCAVSFLIFRFVRKKRL